MPEGENLEPVEAEVERFPTRVPPQRCDTTVQPGEHPYFGRGVRVDTFRTDGAGSVTYDFGVQDGVVNTLDWDD